MSRCSPNNISLPVGGKTVAIPLIQAGGLSAADSTKLNVTEAYTLYVLRGNRRSGSRASVTNAAGGAVVIRKPAYADSLLERRRFREVVNLLQTEPLAPQNNPAPPLRYARSFTRKAGPVSVCYLTCHHDQSFGASRRAGRRFIAAACAARLGTQAERQLSDSDAARR